MKINQYACENLLLIEDGMVHGSGNNYNVPASILRDFIRLVVAQKSLITCYRTGSRPNEFSLEELEKLEYLSESASLAYDGKRRKE
jgi:hypothetical protein